MKAKQIWLKSGTMAFVSTKTEGGGHDLFYQTVHYQATIFNDPGL
jgi:hypothetical protein